MKNFRRGREWMGENSGKKSSSSYSVTVCVCVCVFTTKLNSRYCTAVFFLPAPDCQIHCKLIFNLNAPHPTLKASSRTPLPRSLQIHHQTFFISLAFSGRLKSISGGGDDQSNPIQSTPSAWWILFLELAGSFYWLDDPPDPDRYCTAELYGNTAQWLFI